jgi:hypothetical protein
MLAHAAGIPTDVGDVAVVQNAVDKGRNHRFVWEFVFVNRKIIRC